MLGTAPSKVTAGGDTTDGKNSKGGGNSTAGENHNFTDGNLNSTARRNSPQLLRMQIVKQLQMSILPRLHPSPQLSVFPHGPLSSLLISTANSKASAVNGRGSVSQFRQHSCNKFYIRSWGRHLACPSYYQTRTYGGAAVENWNRHAKYLRLNLGVTARRTRYRKQCQSLHQFGTEYMF